ncbi:PqiC family protein [Paraburkholderia sp. USG1]|uniref:PqiC family protein n=1 Tax=Paraburkholderia sp. USG1 TaxID=2952268 RepID=UPI00285F8A0D|nr:PqiC family protein [Paraburkholderia sp. USG1]MDR8398353.1 PqiC family protein [Paraburkholderia sp. USG1]
MNLLVRAGLASLALALGACASAPVHYYTLVSPESGSALTGQPAPFALDVLPVGIPALLDQQPLVVRQGDSNVAVLDNEQWAAPLGDEVRTALSEELVHRLDAQDVAGLTRPTGKPVLRVRLQVRRLDAWPGQGVQLEADWSLGFAGTAGTSRLTCHSQLQEAASGGYPELVRAQQRIVARLASQIASNARGWAVSQKQDCTPDDGTTSPEARSPEPSLEPPHA